MTKNETIKATLKATREKRKTQMCRVYETKIDLSHLNHATQEHLNRLFLEGKWLRNYVLSQKKIFGMDDKIYEVPVKVKDVFEIRELKCLSSQMRQSIISRVQDDIRGLAEKKKKRYKVGKLKYKSEMQSIPLKQFDNTFKILDKKYVHVQGIKQKLKVIGLKQIPEGADIANGTLIHKNGDYYISITTYQEKKIPVLSIDSVGIDFGLSKQLTGKKILTTSIGGIISTLTKKVHTLIEIPKMYPSTKTCSKCGNIQDMLLDERIYVCKNKNCDNVMDRDYNASTNIKIEGLKQVGMVCTDFKPVEIEANTLMFLRYFNSIPYVKASSVNESGSFTALA